MNTHRFTKLKGFSPDLTVIEEGKRGELILHRKPKTHHPMDNFLEVVLVFWHRKFVVWNRNLQDGGFFDGAYFEKHLNHSPATEGIVIDDDLTLSLEESYMDALANFDMRGLETNLLKLAQERLVRHAQVSYLAGEL